MKTLTDEVKVEISNTIRESYLKIMSLFTKGLDDEGAASIETMNVFSFAVAQHFYSRSLPENWDKNLEVFVKQTKDHLRHIKTEHMAQEMRKNH